MNRKYIMYLTRKNEKNFHETDNQKGNGSGCEINSFAH